MDENAKFTPGPWVLDAAAETITAVSGRVIVYELGTNEADGTLIAAAPEMYAAMAKFVHRCEIGEVRSRKTYEEFTEILAKANGE